MFEQTNIEQDITAICITADSFPEGILEAHQKLHQLVKYAPERKYFGISYQIGPGKIMYQAATEMAPEDDPDALGCDMFFIKKGDYLSKFIPDFTNDIAAIGRCFQEMLQDPRIDPDGYCLEWYLTDKDVKCMVPLAQ